MTRKPALAPRLACLAFVLPLVVPHGAAGSQPVAVSPAAGSSTAATVPPCPTLSWSGVEGARRYRVQIAERLDGGERVVLETEVGDGRSLTLASCLVEGREYAWRVGALIAREPVRWSQPAPFRVIAADSMQVALERVAQRLAAEERISAADLDRLRQWGFLDQNPPVAASAPSSAGGWSAAWRGGPGALHSSGDAAVHVETEDNAAGVVALGADFGIYAEAVDPAGAVAGRATASTGQNAGVFGFNKTTVDGGAPAGTVAVGVRGTGEQVGVKGTSVAPLGRAARGLASFGFGLNHGVVGESASVAGKGVEGRAVGTSDTNFAVWSSAGAGGTDFYANGAGTDYGAFTGAHLARVAADSPPLRPGTVVSVDGEVEGLLTAAGSQHLSSTLPTIRIADGERDPAVLGAYLGEVTLDPGHPWSRVEGTRIAAVNALGEGRLWVSDANGAVRAGDYLTSSSVPGYAQRQDDLVSRAYTVAKAIETVDWSRAESMTVGDRTVRVALVAVVYVGG